MAKRAMLSNATVQAIANRAEAPKQEPRILEDTTHSVAMPPTQADNKPVKISASQRKQSAREVADRIAGNPDIATHFQEEFGRKTGTARFPVELMIDLWFDHPLHDPNKPGLRTADFLSAPVHGSYYEDGKTTGNLLKGTGANKVILAEASNEMADKYNILVTKKGGGTKTQANGGSWYMDVAASHPLGISLIADIKDMELGLETTRKGRYKDEPKDNLESYKRNAETQLRSVSTNIGKVFAMVKLFHRINTELRTQAECKVLTRGVQGQSDPNLRVLATVTDPIIIYDMVERDNRQRFTVGRFLSIDVDKAIKNGGTYAALIDSAKAEESGDDNDDVTVKENTSITTADTALDTFQGLDAFMQDRARYLMYLQKVNSKDQREAEVYISAVVSLSNELSTFVKSHKLDVRYERIMQSAINEASKDKTATA